MKNIETKIVNELVYVRVKCGSRTKIIKAIKRQMFAMEKRKGHHLIGNIYYTILHHRLLTIEEELCHCNVQPIVLTKDTFRHQIKKRKKSLFKHKLNLKDY